MYIDCESVYSSSSAVKQTSETFQKKSGTFVLGTGHNVQEGVGRKNRFSSRQSFSGPPFLVNTKNVAHPFIPDTKITDPPPLLPGAF